MPPRRRRYSPSRRWPMPAACARSAARPSIRSPRWSPSESLAPIPKLGTPIVESTGTGAGFKLFCAGVGERFPDISNASRRMKASEAKHVRRQRRQGRHRNPDRPRRHCGRYRQGDADRRPDPARHLPGARQDAVRQAEQGQDLEGRQRQAAGAFRSASMARRRPAARARCARRADHDRRLRANPGWPP